MTYNYGKQIRVCSKVSYILKGNNDAGDLSPPLSIEEIIDSFTAWCVGLRKGSTGPPGTGLSVQQNTL